MAFMAAPATASNDDRMPFLGFNAKAGRLFLHDRKQQADGEWVSIKTDVTMTQPAFAVDFGRLETGWIHFSNVGPLMSMAFYGQPMPACPESPGNNALGKPLRYKAGFRVPVIGQGIGGLRDFRGNAGALINGMNELHTQYEESGEARAGKIPLVKMTNVLEVHAGQSSNFQPVFTVLRWVERPVEKLGPRMVPPPGSIPPVVRQAVPPVSATIHRMPRPTNDDWAPINDDMPPDDRWDDERPARAASGGARTTYRDEPIPF